MNSLHIRLGNGVFWTTFGNFFIKIFSLFSTLLVLNRFGVYEYGLLELVMSVISVFSIFLLSGLNDVAVSDIGVEKSNQNYTRVQGLFWNFFRLQLLLAIIAWSIVFFGAHLLSIYVSSNIALFLKVASFSFLISPFRSMFMLLCNININFFYQSLYSFLEEAFKLLCLVIVFFVFNMDIEGVILARVLGELLPLIFMTPVFKKQLLYLGGKMKKEKIHFFYFFSKHGKWGLFSRYIDTLGKNIRIWIIKVMLGTEAVGLFAIAEGLFSHTASLLPIGRVVNSAIPQYINKKETLYKLIKKAIKYQIIGYTFVGMGAYVFFPPILRYLFPDYVNSIPLFLFMLPMLIPVSFASIFTAMFFAYKAQALLFKAIIKRVLYTIILTPITIVFFGINGVAISYFFVVLLFVIDRYFVLKTISVGFCIDVKDFIRFDETDRMLLKMICKKLINKDN